MISSLINTIIQQILLLSIIFAPAIIGFKVLTNFRWIHVPLIEILIIFLMYFTGPLGPQPAVLPWDPYSYYSVQFYQSTLLNIKIAYLIVGLAFIWSSHLGKRWYESRVLLYYELVVFVEFIVLIPLFSRWVMFEQIQEVLSILSR
jgi:hypothetical protein